MTASDQILEAVTAAFFPDIPCSSQLQIINQVKAYDIAATGREKAMKLSGFHEQKIWLFFDTALGLYTSSQYVISGFDPDVLNEFPAQRLICVRDNIKEPVDWATFWPVRGGRLFDGQMVALKWDRIWWNISAFNLPVAPFQLGSGYDLEDVDRDEAEAFGLIKPRDRPPVVRIEVDQADLRARISAALLASCG